MDLETLLLIVVAILIIIIILLLIYISRIKYRINLIQSILISVTAITVGGIGGIITNYVRKLDNEVLSIVLGCIIGFLISLVLIVSKPGKWGYKCSQIQVNIPQISQITYIVDTKSRQVAWILFIETITRVSTQPLADDGGYLREALNSLYVLFGVTRDVLRSSEPSKNKTKNEMTVEMLAVLMLNTALRPFLTKWHPLLEDYLQKNPNGSEAEWDLNTECRKELAQVRILIIEYARGFGQLAEVKELDDFFDLNK